MLRLTLALAAAASAQASSSIKLQSGFVLEAPPPSLKTAPSTVWYSASTEDNIVGATTAAAAHATAQHAAKIDQGAAFLSDAGDGLVALKSFYSEALKDTLTTASAEGVSKNDDCFVENEEFL